MGVNYSFVCLEVSFAEPGVARSAYKSSPMTYPKYKNSKYTVPLPKVHILQSPFCKLKTTIW